MDETGSSHEEITLQIENFGKLLYKEIETFSLNFSSVSLAVNFILILILLNKLTRNGHNWTASTVLQLLIICITSVTSLQWGCTIFGNTVCILLILHILRSLPAEQVPVDGKAVLVTGCDRGIGFELAKKLDSMGYQVFAGCLFKGEHGEQELIAACSTRLVTLQMDVRNKEQIKQAATNLQQQLGCNKLWAVINNAGICFIGNIEIMATEDIQTIMAINYMGPVNVCREFLPLIRRCKGRLINVASNTGLAPVPHMAMYCASKSALATFSECLRYEMKQWGVQVSTIIPSGYKTGILAYDKTAVAERWWSCASQTVKEDFGKECFTPVFKYENHESTTSADLSSIVNTIIKAVSEKNAQPFYYSGFLARTLPFVYLHLPSVLQEPTMRVLAHWFNFTPKALKEEETIKEKCTVNNKNHHSN